MTVRDDLPLRDRYDRLVQHAPDGILIHYGDRIVMANEHLAWFRSAGRGMECENVSFGRRADTKNRAVLLPLSTSRTHPLTKAH